MLDIYIDIGDKLGINRVSFKCGRFTFAALYYIMANKPSTCDELHKEMDYVRAKIKQAAMADVWHSNNEKPIPTNR